MSAYNCYLKGINTGFGGSADTRSSAVEEVQRHLIRGLHYGVLADEQGKRPSYPKASHGIAIQLRHALPLEDPLASTSMPESWVRASMLIRLSSLVKGASGVQLNTLETLLQILNRDIVPRIPLRGSISASGDLSPLSYIAGVMMGKPSLQCYYGDRSIRPRPLVSARKALRDAGIPPVDIQAKEGLALTNGTAISAGVASLALHEIMMQSILAQVLTAMAVEALAGTDENFDPFISEIRPHPGQMESAANILSYLNDSKLVFRNDGIPEGSLRHNGSALSWKTSCLRTTKSRSN
jgi:phenylalanine ammonia-lyase